MLPGGAGSLGGSCPMRRPPRPARPGTAPLPGRPARAGGHLRRRHRHQPPAARSWDRRRLRRPRARGLQRDPGRHPARRRRPTPPLLPRRRRRRHRDRHLRGLLGGAGRVRHGRPGARAQRGRRRGWPAALADEYSTPDRPRWVAGSMGPGTKFPTLGQIPFAELRDAYEEQAARPARGRRRPPHHRDRLRPAAGQGGHQRLPAGHGRRRPPGPAPGPGDHRADRPHAAGHRDRRRPDRPRRHAGRRDRAQLRHRAGRDGRAAAPPVGQHAGCPISVPAQRRPALGGRRQDALRPDARAAGRPPAPVRDRARASRRSAAAAGPPRPTWRRWSSAAPAPSRRRATRSTSRRPPRSTPPSRSTRTRRSSSSASAPTPTGPSGSARRCSPATGTPAWPWPATRSRRAPTSSTSASTTPAPTAWPTWPRSPAASPPSRACRS